MREVKNRKTGKESDHEEENLTGTLFSVSVVGVIILLMWFGAYGLYLTR